MQKKRNSLAQVERDGAINALYSRADSIKWEIQRGLEKLPHREGEVDLRFANYRTKICDIESLLETLGKVLDRARALEDKGFKGEPA